MAKHYDLCVIGGGINGTGIARDAAGRGLSVLLVEGDDLAMGTSSASTKLIHGGLRYLEYYDFKLVKESLREREILLQTAPHLVCPMEFVLPLDKDARPEWMVRAGLFLYDWMAGKSIIPKSRRVFLTNDRTGLPLRDHLKRGFVYGDGWADDSRLVVTNAVDAHLRGAEIKTRTICTSLKEEEQGWSVSLHDLTNELDYDVQASAVINATGPWVRRFLDGVGLGRNDPDLPNVRLVQGSHILLPRQYDGHEIYLLQQKDNRVVFVIPYEDHFTLIGTTEVDFDGDPRDAMATEDEISYLCEAYNQAFKAPVLPEDVLFTYSGVRPLFDDGSAAATKVSRDHKIYHHKRQTQPILSVYGGKLTTYRLVAEEAVDKLLSLSFRHEGAWTYNVPLAGGDLPVGGFDAYFNQQHDAYPWLDKEILYRYIEAYGTRMSMIVGDASSMDDLGEDCGHGLYEAEIKYLVRHEWAQTAEDILWRRSKLGLHVDDSAIERIDNVIASIVN